MKPEATSLLIAGLPGLTGFALPVYWVSRSASEIDPDMWPLGAPAVGLALYSLFSVMTNRFPQTLDLANTPAGTAVLSFTTMFLFSAGMALFSLIPVPAWAHIGIAVLLSGAAFLMFVSAIYR